MQAVRSARRRRRWECAVDAQSMRPSVGRSTARVHAALQLCAAGASRHYTPDIAFYTRQLRVAYDAHSTQLHSVALAVAAVSLFMVAHSRTQRKPNNILYSCFIAQLTLSKYCHWMTI